jgi:hypothetical protein
VLCMGLGKKIHSNGICLRRLALCIGYKVWTGPVASKARHAALVAGGGMTTHRQEHTNATRLAKPGAGWGPLCSWESRGQ